VNGDKFEMSRVRWLRFEEFGFMKYRYSFSEQETWKTIGRFTFGTQGTKFQFKHITKEIKGCIQQKYNRN
jgi:hypothetical protein